MDSYKHFCIELKQSQTEKKRNKRIIIVKDSSNKY